MICAEFFPNLKAMQNEKRVKREADEKKSQAGREAK